MFSNHYHPLQPCNIPLPSHVLNSYTRFGQRLNESTSKSVLCCSHAFTEKSHAIEQSQSSSEI